MNRKQEFDYTVTSVIMGGGSGTRLAPLTSKRAKPAVPLAGKFRLIDIPLSNCINSGYNRIYVLTQFNSTSLHRHISESYHFHRFSRGLVEILAAQQTPDRGDARAFWYQGTADAVRKNLPRLRDARGEDVLILSGDQIYTMDFRDVVGTHRGRGGEAADVTIGAVLVTRERARDLGILKVDRHGNVVAFVEKPGKNDALFEGLEAAPELLAQFGVDSRSGPWYLGNMGIYVFRLDVLEAALDNNLMDFGKEVLPGLLGKIRFHAHLFHGYWEDIGTVKAFHEANLELACADSRFNFYSQDWPMYTRARLLPASKVEKASITRSLVAEGCVVDEVVLDEVILGIRSVARKGSVLRRTYMMGADSYESDEDRRSNRERGIPDFGIGEGCVIENAILDKDVRIGKDVRLVNAAGLRKHSDEENGVYIRDGVIVVVKDAVIRDGFEL